MFLVGVRAITGYVRPQHKSEPTALPDRLTFRAICGFSLHLTMHCQEIGERTAQSSSA
jgi:hypothetical protein